MIEDGVSADRIHPARRWPALRIVAAVRMAFDLRKIMVATLGLVLLQFGWVLLDRAVPGATPAMRDPLLLSQAASPMPIAWPPLNATMRLSQPVRILLMPLLTLLNPGSPWIAELRALLKLAWVIIVWGFCGGAIARIAVVQEARSAQTGILDALRFARRSAIPLVMAPTYPMLGLFVCALTGMALGLVYWIPMGSTVAGVLLVLPMLAGLIMTLLVAALVAGWPMFHAALASGADDALDALSRTYSYLNQRLSSFIAGVAIAGFAGLFGLLIADGLAEIVIRLTQWSLSLLGPSAEIAALFDNTASASGTFAPLAHQFWLSVVRLLAHAWVYSYFWSAAAMLYLWLRREVDGTPIDTIDPITAEHPTIPVEPPAPSPGT